MLAAFGRPIRVHQDRRSEYVNKLAAAVFNAQKELAKWLNAVVETAAADADLGQAMDRMSSAADAYGKALATCEALLQRGNEAALAPPYGLPLADIRDEDDLATAPNLNAIWTAQMKGQLDDARAGLRAYAEAVASMGINLRQALASLAVLYGVGSHTPGTTVPMFRAEVAAAGEAQLSVVDDVLTRVSDALTFAREMRLRGGEDGLEQLRFGRLFMLASKVAGERLKSKRKMCEELRALCDGDGVACLASLAPAEVEHLVSLFDVSSMETAISVTEDAGGAAPCLQLPRGADGQAVLAFPDVLECSGTRVRKLKVRECTSSSSPYPARA